MLCNHSWSRIKRVQFHSKYWIDIEKCRRTCQQRQLIKYQVVLSNGAEKVVATKLPLVPSEPERSEGERIPSDHKTDEMNQMRNRSVDQSKSSVELGEVKGDYPIASE